MVELEVQVHLMQLQEQQHLTQVVAEVVVELIMEKMVDLVELEVVELDLQTELVLQELQTLVVVAVVDLDVILIAVEQVVQVSWSQERLQRQELFFKQHQVERFLKHQTVVKLQPLQHQEL